MMSIASPMISGFSGEASLNGSKITAGRRLANSPSAPPDSQQAGLRTVASRLILPFGTAHGS